MLERRPDGLHFTLLPPGFLRSTRERFYGGLVVGIAWCSATLPLLALWVGPQSTRRLSLGELLFGMGVAFLGLVTPFLVAIGRARSSAFLAMTGDVLTLRRRELFWSRRRVWKRSEILAIVPGGLWLIDTNDRFCLFRERDRDEMGWVAARLSEALDLDHGSPDALEVLIAIDIWGKTDQAWLHARRGRLTIYCTGGPSPYFRFDAVPAPLFLQWRTFVSPGQPFALAPGDIRCRIEAGDAAKLQLTPSGTRFQLDLSCEDGAGLQRALACFWGAGDAAA